MTSGKREEISCRCTGILEMSKFTVCLDNASMLVYLHSIINIEQYKQIKNSFIKVLKTLSESQRI